MMNNSKKKSKVSIILTAVLIFLTLVLTGVTFAWFTDRAEINQDGTTLYFGKIELDPETSGPLTSMTLSVNRANGDSADYMMPGDTVNLKVNVKLKDDSQPAYYLVYLEHNNLFENDKNYFFKSGNDIYATDGTTTNKVNADGTLSSETSSALAGKIDAGETHEINFVQQIGLRKTEKDLKGKKNVTCTICIIQQQNIEDQQAFTQMNTEATKSVTFVGNFANNTTYTKIGFYRTLDVPSSLSYNESLTSTYDAKVTDTTQKGLIKWYSNTDGTEIAVASDYKISVPNCIHFFNGCTNLNTITLRNFDTSNAVNMLAMFGNCSSLISLDITNFKTDNVTDMGYMFYGCSSLTKLNIGKLNAKKVTSMSDMFGNCVELKSLNLSGVATENLTNMYAMFSGCRKMVSINVSNFNTSKVTNMANMFRECNVLKILDLSNFCTENTTTMRMMFTACKSITSLNLSSFDTQKVTDMSEMFSYCSALTGLNLSNFITGEVTTMYGMFYSCTNLLSLNVSGFNTSKVTNMSYMFCSCSNLPSLDLSSFNTSVVDTWAGMLAISANISNPILIIGTDFKINGTQPTKAEVVSTTSLNARIKLMRNGVEVTA